jgi:hypothetical protein
MVQCIRRVGVVGALVGDCQQRFQLPHWRAVRAKSTPSKKRRKTFAVEIQRKLMTDINPLTPGKAVAAECAEMVGLC